MCEEGAAQVVGGDDLSASLKCDLDFSFLGKVIKPWHRSAAKTPPVSRMKQWRYLPSPQSCK